MPSLPRLSLAQASAALAAMGKQLRFVRSCRLRMLLRDGSDVTRNGTPLQVIHLHLRTTRAEASIIAFQSHISVAAP